jgi:putative hydrolase of the HAD superfamily
MFKVIGLDADDTLWENEIFYRRGRKLFNHLLSSYPVDVDVETFVHNLEIQNLDTYGYGAAGFVLSLIEAADALTKSRFSSQDTVRLIDHLKVMLSTKVQLLEGASGLVATLAEMHRLVLITKGDLRHQRLKVDDSGLAGYFERVEIVSEKSPDVYSRIIADCGIDPGDFLMVGNSLRSDILPVLEIDAWAIYVPNELTWSHETLEDLPLHEPRFAEAATLNDVPGLVEALEAQDE